MPLSNALKTGYFLIGLSAVLLVYTIATTSVSWIEPTELGFVSKMPLTYWIGLFLLTFVWYIGRKSKYCLTASLVLTFSYLYVAPAIIRVSPWISNSYYPYGEALMASSTGHLTERPATGLLSYFDWPLFLYLASEFVTITAIPDAILLKFFPLLLISLYAILSVLILRRRLGLPLAIIGAGFVLSSFFIRQQYFGPQGFAYVFFLMMMLFVSWLFFDSRMEKRTIVGLFLLVFTLTTFSHPLTSFMLIILTGALFITYRLVLKTSLPIIGGLCLVSGIIWVSYNAHLATKFFNQGIQHFWEIITGFREIAIYSEPSRIVGSMAMQLNFAASWAIVLLGGSVALVSIVWVVKRIRKGENSNDFSVFCALMLIMFGAFAFVGEYGAHEAYQRAFMFGLIPLAYLCVILLAKRPALLILLLSCLLFLNIPAQYGGDTYRLAADTQLAGTKFVAVNTPQDISLIGRFSLYIRYHDPTKRYEILQIGEFPYKELPDPSLVSEVVSESDYIMFSRLERNYYSYFLGMDPLEDVYSKMGLNRLYDNSNFQLLQSPDNSP